MVFLSFYIQHLASAPTGIIIHCTLNAPGSWHDAAAATDLYERLLKRTPEGYYVIRIQHFLEMLSD